MDNSPYLSVLNDGIHYLLQSNEEALDLQDPNLKTSIFTEIEDVAKEWSVELPVLMEDQTIQETPTELAPNDNNEPSMGLTTDLPSIYEETLPHHSPMVLDTNEATENEVETEVMYPIEGSDRGFITADGFFIANDMLLQLNFDEHNGTTSTCESNNQAVVSQVDNQINKRTLLKHKLPEEDICKNVPSSNSMEEMYKNYFEVVTAHKCKLCGFLSEEKAIIIQHCHVQHLNEVANQNGTLKSSRTNELHLKSITRNGKTQTIYICSICNFGYGSTDKLKLHMILTHKLSKIPEELESNSSVGSEKNGAESCKSPIKPEEKKKMQMSLLRQQSKASKKIKCSVKGCDLRFAIDDMRARHEKCHIEGQKQFKCSECDLKFSMWRLCSSHLWRCHSLDMGLFTCPMCNAFKATTTVALINHMAIHEEEKPYICQVCFKGFKQHSQLVNHNLLHKDSNQLPGWASQQQCEKCLKYFANSKTLKKHVKSVHDKFKPFICSVCGHKTARKSMLELHLRQHTGEKPHQCQICLYRTGDHNSLRRHVMRHSGHSKYSCPHCDYQSIQSTAYKNHIATKHPGLGGSFICSLCSYQTVNENTYAAHLGDHEKGLINEVPKTARTDNVKAYKNGASTLNENTNCSDEQITIQLTHDAEDDETHNYLSLLEHSNDAVDTGGITIPAGYEMPE